MFSQSFLPARSDNMKKFVMKIFVWLQSLLLLDVFAVVIGKDFYCSKDINGFRIENATLTQNDRIIFILNGTDENLEQITIHSSHFEGFSTANIGLDYTQRRHVELVNCSGLKTSKNISFDKYVDEISITDSDIETVDGDYFTNNRLISLKLNNNLIKTVDKNAFTHLVGVERIDLKSNQITSLDDETFKACQTLKLLVLSSNQITQISSTLFSENHNLRELKIASNEIIAVQKGSFSNLKSLHKLDLTGNVCIAEETIINQGELIATKLSRKLKSCYIGYEQILSVEKTMNAAISRLLKENDDLRNALEEKFNSLSARFDLSIIQPDSSSKATSDEVNINHDDLRDNEPVSSRPQQSPIKSSDTPTVIHSQESRTHYWLISVIVSLGLSLVVLLILYAKLYAVIRKLLATKLEKQVKRAKSEVSINAS